ncbi:hypothetical protein I79_002631 [Cricetulus griseus]|uniref:Uncharacterized protein n=1 Tax=Cricetulus griseus TaxID=10029 RepID=G3GXY6_CRIGR|nr:hypothetical protein I79_002631 [Cricetulus griseus]
MGIPGSCCCKALPAVFSPAAVLLDTTHKAFAALFLHKYFPRSQGKFQSPTPVLPTQAYFSPWLLQPACPPNINAGT